MLKLGNLSSCLVLSNVKPGPYLLLQEKQIAGAMPPQVFIDAARDMCYKHISEQ
jgi:hypothetical protein